MSDSTVTEGMLKADMPHRHHALGHIRDRIIASDPAFTRLRLASRALLSVLINLALLAGLSRFLPLPAAAYGMAVIASFPGSMAVQDKTPGDQAITRMIAAACAIACVFLAALLGARPLIGDLTFLVVIFAAVYIRKFGQRGVAVGMITFMAYFMGDYLHPRPQDIGWIALAVALAFTITHIVTQFVLKDDPERNFRRAMVTLNRRINVIMHDILEKSQNGEPPSANRQALQQQLSQLRDIVMMAEGFIPQGDEGSLATSGAASDLAIALFEVQFIVERMVRASYLELPAADLLAAVLYRDSREIKRQSDALGENTREEVASRLLLRLNRARERLDAQLASRPSPAFAPVPSEPKSAPPTTSSSTAPTSIVPISLQRPIQVTVACAAAMGVGLMISPTRWTWAVIAAFIVFNNTKSRADTAIRALQRSAGTLGGFLVGTVIATVLQGHVITSAIAIPVLFFFAFYVLQRSYSLMIFFITIALALLYGVMGMFTWELLLLRLGETLVGALAGTAAAFFIFPTRVTTGVAAALGKYLDALGALVSAAQKTAHGEKTDVSLFSLSRSLDRSYAELSTVVRPLGGPWNAVTQFGEVREKLLVLTGCAHWSRTLVRSLRSGKVEKPETLERIDALADEVQRRIDAARAVKESFFDRPHPGEDDQPAPTRPPLPITPDEDPALSLEVISALLARATPVAKI